MERTLDGLQNPGVRIMTGENLVDLEYADDIVLLFEELEASTIGHGQTNGSYPILWYALCTIEVQSYASGCARSEYV